MNRTIIVAAAVYVLGFVGTFGHAHVAIESTLTPTSYASASERAILGAGLVALAWPLYWSVQLARKV